MKTRRRRMTKGALGVLERASDKILGAVAPVAQMRREQARFALSAVSSYDSADANRNSWVNRNTSDGDANADLDRDTLAELRERSRDRVRNDSVAAAAIGTMVDNIVGTGMRPVLRIDHDEAGITEDQAKALTRQANTIWEDWGRSPDFSGRLSVEDLQAQVMSQVLMNGDVFLRPSMVSDPYQPSRFELRIQVIEGDVCDTPYASTAPKGRRIFNGVEVGRRDQPVAYWMSDFHPGMDPVAGGVVGGRNFRRFKAHHASGRPAMLHVFKQERPQQTRGVPILAPVLNLLKDRHDYKEAALIAAQVGACFAAFIKTPDPFGHAAGSASETVSGVMEEDMSPGMMMRLGPGEDVAFGDPKQPTAQFEGFLHTVTVEIMQALGMPAQLVTKDFGGMNYSSARAALLEARRVFKCRQEWLIRQALQPIWMMLLEEAWLKGEFDAGDFMERPWLWTRTAWSTPGWGWVDPQKEVAAHREALELGLTTREAIIKERDGGNWRDVQRQLAEEQEFRSEVGLGVDADLDTDTGGEPVSELASAVLDARAKAEVVQKVYLGKGTVMTDKEIRDLILAPAGIAVAGALPSDEPEPDPEPEAEEDE